MKPKKYRAMPTEIFQFLLGKTSHEPLIRCLLEFSGTIDEEALKRAVMLSVNRLPLLSSVFCPSPGRPHWEQQDFSAEDFVKPAGIGPEDSAGIMRLLASPMDASREPQLRIYHIPGASGDRLCIVMNHLVCDGAGFKEYLYLLSGLYIQCAGGSPAEKESGVFLRGMFRFFSLRVKLRALFSKLDLPRFREQGGLTLEGGDHPFFAIQTVGREAVEAAKRYAKSRNATLNDMILAAYARVFCRETGRESVLFPCPADLRRYMPNRRRFPVCNLTGNYPCFVTFHAPDPFEQTLSEVAAQMQAHKRSLGCLKAGFVWEIAARFLPFVFLERNFTRLFYTPPVISYTNLGMIDDGRLRFAGADAVRVFLTGATKRPPFFQLSALTYRGELTMSVNLFGTKGDRIRTEDFLREVSRELTRDAGQ